MDIKWIDGYTDIITHVIAKIMTDVEEKGLRLEPIVITRFCELMNSSFRGHRTAFNEKWPSSPVFADVVACYNAQESVGKSTETSPWSDTMRMLNAENQSCSQVINDFGLKVEAMERKLRPGNPNRKEILLKIIEYVTSIHPKIKAQIESYVSLVEQSAEKITQADETRCNLLEKKKSAISGTELVSDEDEGYISMQGLFAEVNQTVSVHTQTVLNDEIGPDDVIVSMQAITSMANKIECLKNSIKIVVAENVALREQENPPKRPMLLNWLFKPKFEIFEPKGKSKKTRLWNSVRALFHVKKA